MKKTYLKPTTAVVVISLEQHLLTLSDPNAGLTNKTVDAGSIESRGGSDWDDED